MFIRYVSQRTKGKTYRYPQLVESYRKPDGTPAHRILCTLTNLSDVALANLKKALEAGRTGERLTVAPDAARLFRSVGVAANLRYLDIAVAYQQWQDLKLHSLLSDLLGGGKSDVPHQDVVCALVLHRCTDPGSKLAAAGWYPKTSLPQLQGIAPARFGNTRIHRTLEALERIDDRLQERLVPQLQANQGAFAALFLDITDTWFEGRGPQMAYSARTKEGMLRHKVGVMLLCDQRGYPLRWKALPGNYYEADVMGSLVDQISTLDWVHHVPVVLDRMMGKASTLTQLSASNVRFVTALPATEFESWTLDVPWQPLAEVSLACTETSSKDDRARILAALQRTRMVKARDDRWLLDLEVVTRDDLGHSSELGVVAEAVRIGASIKADLDAGVVRSQAQWAEQNGVSTPYVLRYLKLARLRPEIQRRVLEGEGETLSLHQLQSVASKPAQRQKAAFNALLKKASKTRMGRTPKLPHGGSRSGLGVSLRLVASFNPEAFLNERKKAIETRREVDAFVADLNRRLRSPQSRRTEASIHAEVDRFLRAKKWVGLFKVTLEGQATGNPQVKLVLDEQAWERRRRYDGFSLFAAHPDLPKSAADIVEIYFAKDAVEKDFQTIKSELELRPIRHWTDHKVRAHVTICMLALLIERQLELRLRTAGRPMSAASLFDALSSVHLNKLRIGDNSIYTVTDRDPDVTELLAALGMQHLVDDDLLAQQIRPRAASTP